MHLDAEITVCMTNLPIDLNQKGLLVQANRNDNAS